MNNVFKDIPAELPEELIQVLAGGAGCRIERILSRGHGSPEGFWYDQDEHEFVLLLSGEAELELQAPAERRRLGPGDWLTIAAHRRHRVNWTHPQRDTLWLAVFFAGDSGPASGQSGP
ncbi:cupin domain-containing protein [Zobellella taiwanensis]|jgi:cupin 2 domain-containing protein|uniref:Phosphoribosylaminoimidazole carboxylase n=1 Tax=Zobellella taiwanensis TaxID=347535 RepID=A0A2P7R9P1_9GAMM|nr:cupin domain-containing protein [Zobellella taiwanensis]PSJ46910.1 phosphoribosylaminoimidazole carboxylase [Zobellella taiwanensis]